MGSCCAASGGFTVKDDDEFRTICELNPSQIRDLELLYRKEWWTNTREFKDIKTMLENSDLVIGILESATGKLVAFTRVLSDFVYKGLILDVIVAHDYRQKKLGRRLMDTILNHPKLKAVHRFELYCLPEMAPFYEKWGFVETKKVLFMVRESVKPGEKIDELA